MIVRALTYEFKDQILPHSTQSEWLHLEPSTGRGLHWKLSKD